MHSTHLRDLRSVQHEIWCLTPWYWLEHFSISPLLMNTSMPSVRLSSRTRILASCRDSTWTRGDRIDDVQFVVIQRICDGELSHRKTHARMSKKCAGNCSNVDDIEDALDSKIKGLIGPAVMHAIKTLLPCKSRCPGGLDSAATPGTAGGLFCRLLAWETNLRTGSSPRDLRWLL